MKTVTRERIKVDGNVRSTITTTTRTINWKRIPTSWQLPCGCIGPDIWTSDEVQESECTDCGRGWRHMAASGPGSKGVYGHYGHCVMLDGQPQGQPVLVLSEEMLANV